MSNFTVTFYEGADPALVSEIQVRLAKLKPACTQCGRVLTKKELATRRCAARDDCVLRQIFHVTPRSAYEWTIQSGRFERKPLALAEVHKLREFHCREKAAPADGFPVLPPACVRCGKKLTARELDAGRECSGRAACTKRSILSFRAPNFLAERYAEAWAREHETSDDETEEEIAA